MAPNISNSQGMSTSNLLAFWNMGTPFALLVAGTGPVRAMWASPDRVPRRAASPYRAPSPSPLRDHLPSRGESTLETWRANSVRDGHSAGAYREPAPPP